MNMFLYVHSLYLCLFSSTGALTGQHSPGGSSVSGRSPSPPTPHHAQHPNNAPPTGGPGNTPSAQQLPPACGARQLSKLKRFLTTLIQFGTDISPEIGERVRSLVLALVVTIEYFIQFLPEQSLQSNQSLKFRNIFDGSGCEPLT